MWPLIFLLILPLETIPSLQTIFWMQSMSLPTAEASYAVVLTGKVDVYLGLRPNLQDTRSCRCPLTPSTSRTSNSAYL